MEHLRACVYNRGARTYYYPRVMCSYINSSNYYDIYPKYDCTGIS